MEPNERTSLLGANDRPQEDATQAPAPSSSDQPLAAEEAIPRRRWTGRTASGLVVIVIALLGAALWIFVGGYGNGAPDPRDPEPELNAPIRVMIVGDSISQGWEGDYTWRYRIWQWFRDNHINATFVGPYTGTAAPDEHLLLAAAVPHSLLEAAEAGGPPELETDRMDGGYARDVVAAFVAGGSAHASVWGLQAAQTVDRIGPLVAAHRPDLLLVELGFNDLGWFVGGPDDTLLAMKRIVDRARAANPELKFALANVPSRSYLPGRDDLPVNTRDYNEKLRNAIPLWSYPSSPIGLVNFEKAYSCGASGCPAAYDGLHPNSQGEYEIAYAFTQTLYEKFSMGLEPLPLPPSYPARPCPVPEHPGAVGHRDGIKFSWDSVYGAYFYQVQIRHKDAAWPPDGSYYFTQAPSFDAKFAADGKPWKFRVRTHCGTTVQSGWTPVVSATARKDEV